MIEIQSGHDIKGKQTNLCVGLTWSGKEAIMDSKLLQDILQSSCFTYILRSTLLQLRQD